LIDYSQGNTPPEEYVSGATQWSAGVFGNSQISEHLAVQLHVGYSDYIPDNTGTAGAAGNDSGLYFSASLTHTVNQWLKYSLTAGQSTDLSSFGSVQSRTFVQLSPGYTLFDHYSISTPVMYQEGSQPGYTPTGGGSAYEQYSVSINVSRPITKKLTATAGYQFVEEESQLSGLAYTVNIISLNLMYQF